MQGLALHIPFYSFSCCQEPYPYQEPPSPEMSPASSSSIAGDHIGLESCLDMVKTGEEVVVAAAGSSVGYCYYSERVQQRREQREEMRRKEYPPPIPLLARTENLPSHMPWVLKRYYTGDGRLILREEKVRHHEYLRAHREDGRLTLHLVPMDDNVMNMKQSEDHYFDEEEEEYCHEYYGEEEEVGHEHEHEKVQVAEAGACDDDDDNDDDVKDINGGGEHECGGVVNVGVVGGGGGGGCGGGGGGKCLAYRNTSANGVGSSCIFGVPISPIRPVHS